MQGLALRLPAGPAMAMQQQAFSSALLSLRRAPLR